ncbi:[NiFe]-hydrogenase assembly chaperone HybE [Pontibacterium sp. N1Y112]|uniref:[NiFe]-hydrogenase assembly chaperone HybE n=1 Tax=Pontibacterium sinense TaxID=2781979 RepID=A0A8J7F9D2_9GAMM|nr:[NiFe]-hydrogenase assembly chaperone HybE [Pontibacterium sinense]MBE9397375.1 [NiFe]-hydrogenase assembly chaperone HybE [Pontibacterium sinense]
MNQVTALQAHFDLVSERMADLPVYNSHLVVETVGFKEFAGRELGVLITPWCMNLMLLPAEADVWFDWDEQHVGAKQMIALPSGQYEFIFGWAEAVGGYCSCSLFSPMSEFEAQDVAVETAQEVMKALFDGDNEAPTDRQRAQREQREQERSAQNVDPVTTEPVAVSESAKEKPTPEKLSRRGFLTAGFARRSTSDARPKVGGRSS